MKNLSSTFKVPLLGLLFSLGLLLFISPKTAAQTSYPLPSTAPVQTLFEQFQAITYTGTDNNIYRMEFGSGEWHTQQLTWDGKVAGDPVPFDNGSPHILFRDTNDHLQLLYQVGTDWHKRQLTQWLNERAAKDPTIYEFKSVHIIYQGLDEHIHELVLDGEQLTHYRLTDGDEQKAAGPPVGFERNESQNIVYRLKDGHIAWMNWTGETWARERVTGAGDTLAAGDPQFHFWKTQHFVYRGVDDQLHELILNQNGWTSYQLTQGEAQKVAGNMVGLGSTIPSYTQVLTYHGADGLINTLIFNEDSGSWTHSVLNSDKAPPADLDSKFSTYFFKNHRVLYGDTNGQIQELILTPFGLTSSSPTELNNPLLKGTPAGFSHTATAPLPEPTNLKELAAVHELEFGPAVNQIGFDNDPVYKEMLAREFNMVSTESQFKFGPIHPEKDRYFFEDADALVEFVQDNRMTMRGHTLIWHTQQPAWLEFGGWNRDEMIDIMEEHISTVVGRYKGEIKYWDVVNEAIDEDTNQMRETFWLETIGPEFVDIAFRAAHAADPDAILIYNDYGNSHINPKSDAIYEMVSGMVERGVPIHGVAFQLHISTHLPFDIESIRANMDRFADLGLVVQFSEIDVRIWRNTRALPNRLVLQGERYHDLMELCLEHPACDTYQTWGITDKYTWVYTFFGGDYPQEAPLPWDASYNPKPAYYGLIKAMSPETSPPLEVTPAPNPVPTATPMGEPASTVYTFIPFIR